MGNYLEQEILDIFYKRVLAIINGDIEVLERLIHTEFEYTNSFGKKHNKESYIHTICNSDNFVVYGSGLLDRLQKLQMMLKICMRYFQKTM